MTETSYKQALKDAREELVKLLGQQEEINRRVDSLKQTVEALSALCGEEFNAKAYAGISDVVNKAFEETLELIHGKPSLTDATRAVLKTFGRPMTAVEVRDGLTSLGYDLSIYSNVVASLHTILKRLHANGEAFIVTTNEGKQAYQAKIGPVIKPESIKKSQTSNAIKNALKKGLTGSGLPEVPINAKDLADIHRSSKK